MLDRQKLIKQLTSLDQQVFQKSNEEQNVLKKAWNAALVDNFLVKTLQAKKWSVLIPCWQGSLDFKVSIKSQPHPYQILAVDGSQIYYDRHQGPACYLINVGSVFFSYDLIKSSVQLESVPQVMMLQDLDDYGSQDQVNLAREQSELSQAVRKADQIQKLSSNPFLTLFDGTLIFFQAEGATEQKENHFAQFMNYFQTLYDQKILHAGYVSFPKSKELINVLKLILAKFDENNMSSVGLQKFVDMDVTELFLQYGQRSIIFASKAPITYFYPMHLKPHFCYLHVGSEIARLEFPAWIAEQQNLVDQICAIVLDQVDKGNGYPVALFEAHEQAVVKTADRDFFYYMIQKMVQNQNATYQISKKSLKKIIVPV